MLTLGQNIVNQRTKQGITQAQLAEAAAITQPNLSCIEKDKRDMTVSTLKRISAALSVSPARLLDEKTDQTPRKTPLSRARIERIARMVTSGSLNESADAQIAYHFRQLLPSNTVRRRSAKRVIYSWLELQNLFQKGEIKDIFQRIKDERSRRA